MASLPVIEVRGDPRTMGQAQGHACREAVHAAVSTAGVAHRGRMAASLLPFTGGRQLGAGMGREIVRHYPHLSERIQGLARGAGQNIESLMGLFVGAAEGRFERALGAPADATVRGGETPLLARSIAGAEWLVRRSRPDVGFASVELTLPWLATAIAGVNEAGVAAVVAPGRLGRPNASGPSVLLLVQECLQRFDDVTGCIDWCSKRPLSGGARILLADASGSGRVVEIDDDERRVVAVPAEPTASLDELEESGSSRVAVSPGERSLRIWREGGAESEVFGVD